MIYRKVFWRFFIAKNIARNRNGRYTICCWTCWFYYFECFFPTFDSFQSLLHIRLLFLYNFACLIFPKNRSFYFNISMFTGRSFTYSRLLAWYLLSDSCIYLISVRLSAGDDVKDSPLQNIKTWFWFGYFTGCLSSLHKMTSDSFLIWISA